MHQWNNCFLAHERLAIIDPLSGDQPLYNSDRTIAVAVNGEIYNHK
jgi:asparagine synthase (glutamine-hydrolysing)